MIKASTTHLLFSIETSTKKGDETGSYGLVMGKLRVKEWNSIAGLKYLNLNY